MKIDISGRPASMAPGLVAFLSLLGLAGTAPVAAAGEASHPPLGFAEHVRPILQRRCASCHAGGNEKGGFSLETRDRFLEGGDSGAAVEPGAADRSRLVAIVSGTDPKLVMPPKGERLTPEEVAVLRLWIDQGARWEAGSSVAPAARTAPVAPRRPELPAPRAGRGHPIDRIVDAYWRARGIETPPPAEDAVFLRRASMDLIGLLPSPEELRSFVADASPDKRERAVARLLADRKAYADHWLSFWNDLLRNDYEGTGFIDGGRKQITSWLYDALRSNKPYDAFVRELIDPKPGSEGFSYGIQWRGRVNASQVRELQFSQNVSQVFLGVNMKCASCHDSFVSEWKLSDAYGLAAIFADGPLELHRCDVPTGQAAVPRFLFPEIGDVDPAAARPQRLARLAELLTSERNGRLRRTVVNRLWGRLLGRAIVEPVDAMDGEPWSADLLDWLAVDLADRGHDLKRTLATIATSRAYQAACAAAASEDDRDFAFRGPWAKRMTAEQFLDSVWAITGTGPMTADAPIGAAPASALPSRWIWSRPDAGTAEAAGREIVLERAFEVPFVPARGTAVLTCDNAFSLSVNGKEIVADDDWQSPAVADIGAAVVRGANRVTIVARNLGDGPNPAGLWAFLRIRGSCEGEVLEVPSDGSWRWTEPARAGDLAGASWSPAAVLDRQDFLGPSIRDALALAVSRSAGETGDHVRASLRKSSALMRSLGRPNREQVVSARPSVLTTLEALDLTNGAELVEILEGGARNLLARHGGDGRALAEEVWLRALSRPPGSEELEASLEIIGAPAGPAGVEDFLWGVFMSPEFQLIR